MRLLVGIDLDRVTYLDRIDPMCGYGVSGDYAGHSPRASRGQRARKVPHCPAGDTAEDQQAYRCGDLRQLTVTPVPPFFADTRNAQAVRDRPGGLRCKGGPERLALFGVLRKSLLRPGVRREVGLDRRGAMGRQAPIYLRMQLVFVDGTIGGGHPTLVSAALRRRWPL